MSSSTMRSSTESAPTSSTISVRRGSAYFARTARSSSTMILEDLAALEAGEALQAHLEDGLGLHLGEPERRHQAVARGGRVGRAADEGDRLVEMLDRDPEAGQDVQSLLRLAEIVCRPAGDDLAAMLDEDTQRIFQVE